jgi:hypothetical protein
MKDSQRKSELAIFRAFAEVCPLNVALTSIENRDPPEPDIVCAIGYGAEQVAFELVEIIDRGWACVTSGQFRDANSLRDGYKSSAGGQRIALDERLGNALVSTNSLRPYPLVFNELMMGASASVSAAWVAADSTPCGATVMLGSQ